MGVNFGLVIGVTLLISLIGGGGAWLLYAMSRPKKIFWTAKVYQLGAGVRKSGNFELSDLKPYVEDVLEKIEKAHGITVFKLVNLGKTTGAVSADLVDVWGQNKKEVKVLLKDDNATLLSSGYDNVTGNAIFNPVPRERIEMINSEREIKKNRLVKQKDILQAITPWVVAGICMVGLIFIVYLIANSAVDSSENYKEAIGIAKESQVETASIYRDAASIMKGVPLDRSSFNDSSLGVQNG